MHWTNTALSQEIRPVLLRVFVVDAVLEVVWQQVLELNRGVELDAHIGVDAGRSVKVPSKVLGGDVPCQRIDLVESGVHLEIERW